MDNQRLKLSDALSHLQSAGPEARKKLNEDLSRYLDIIQELLTFAEELPEKKRIELLQIIDKMIEHYKELEDNLEKVVGLENEKWPSPRRQ